MNHKSISSSCRLAFVISFAFCLALNLSAQIVTTNDPPVYGPYNAAIAAGGDGVHRKMVEKDTVLRAESPWTMYGWVWVDAAVTGPQLVAGYGDVGSEYSRYIGLEPGKLLMWAGPENSFSAPAMIPPSQWQFVAATFDGQSVFRLYSDGAQVGQGVLALGRVAPIVRIAPPVPTAVPGMPSFQGQHFGGKVAGFTIVREALSADKIKQFAGNPPNFALVEFEEGAKPWPVQTRGQAGYRAPQDPATYPKSRAPYPAGGGEAGAARTGDCQADGENQWQLTGGWMMAASPTVKASTDEMVKPGFATKDWMVATVPGTALTTMIDRGIYPDPDYGLNNLAIPESLAQQDYWYRVEFKAPAATRGSG